MNKKPFLFAGSIALGIIALTLIFMAGNATAGCGKFQGKEMRGNMMRNFDGKGKMNMKDGIRRQIINREMRFIDESSLTAEQKTQLEKIRDSQQQKMQDLMQSFRTGSGISQTEISTKVETLWKEHMAELRPFVAQDKLDEFDAFVKEGKPNMTMIGGKRRMW